jgi:ATP-dependent DNA ligase
MAARIDRGQAQLLTRTGLDWTDKYPSVVAALAQTRAKTAYRDGELCGVGDDGLPSFSQTRAASDGERGVRLVYYAFDLLHLDGRDTASFPLIERKALLEPLTAGTPGLLFNAHETGDGETVRQHACKLGFEGVVSKTIDAPYAPGNRGLWRNSKCLNRQEFVVVGWTDPEGSPPEEIPRRRHQPDCHREIDPRGVAWPSGGHSAQAREARLEALSKKNVMMGRCVTTIDC